MLNPEQCVGQTHGLLKWQGRPYCWMMLMYSISENEFFYKIKRDGTTILHGIHDEKLNH